MLTLEANRITTLDAVLLARLLLTGVIVPAAIVMASLFLFILLRLMLRNTWVAAAAVVGVSALMFAGTGTTVSAIGAVVFVSILLWVTLRFGILPGTLIVVISTLVGTVPLTSDLSAWYASRGLVMVALTLALPIWSFRNALGGRKVLKDGFLEA